MHEGGKMGNTAQGAATRALGEVEKWGHPATAGMSGLDPDSQYLLDSWWTRPPPSRSWHGL